MIIQESADANTVISALNKIKFGDGYLTAEYKKDREEDQNIGPNDIDPHTLYVGNLAQEITKEDMVKTYPKCKRIDIGYAKKMKYTRYAFVTFKSVQDSIEAFKKTHSTQMYSKSLIVRFRRLHGTVGMPGESKPQNPPKNKDGTGSEETSETTATTSEHIDEVSDDLNSVKDTNEDVNLNLVKTEPDSSGDEDDDLDDNICDITEHRPLKLEVKSEPSEEVNKDEGSKLPKLEMLEVKKKEVDDIKEELEEEEEMEEPPYSKYSM